MAIKEQRQAEDIFDVIVIGGGLSGLAATCLLASHGVRVLCLDREPAKAQLSAGFDGRTTAISYGSQKVLDAAGVWKKCQQDGSPIRNIQILDGDSPVLLDFDSSEVEGRVFGWIFENHLLRKALLKRLAELDTANHTAPAHVTGFTNTDDNIEVRLSDGSSYKASLVIGADGRSSFTREAMGITSREWQYNQRAIVCTVIHDNPHDDIAVEHFHASGPFAILPMTDDEQGNHRSSVVWTEHGPSRQSALHYEQASFDAALTARFPERYGKVRQTGKRFSFPLGLVHAHSYIAPRVALVADAAHGIHPIAGQGLNMGYRDIAELAPLVIDAVKEGRDPGAQPLLDTYQQRRRLDNMAMAGATDTLNRLFSNDIPPVRAARRMGLRIISRLPPAKKFFMKQAMGASGLLPELIKESKAA